MHYERPIVMSIAGFDPSGGAGMLADIKTFEQHQCLGMGVVTAWTVQTEHTFQKVEWLSLEKIKEQAKLLLDVYAVAVIKIGIVESLKALLALVVWLKEQVSNICIIWDTVLSASTGFLLTDARNTDLLKSVLNHVFLITPNVQEARLLSGMDDEEAAAKQLAHNCNVLLKGGHSEAFLGTDRLFTAQKETQLLPSKENLYPKHGSGCILSAAITANLAKGVSLASACEKAKAYIETILGSNQNLLAYHV